MLFIKGGYPVLIIFPFPVQRLIRVTIFMNQKPASNLIFTEMIYISIIESCFGRNKNKHTEGNTVGSFPECGNSAFVEHMLFAHADKEHDKTCKCLNDPPCPLKDNVRQILIIQCVTS